MLSQSGKIGSEFYSEPRQKLTHNFRALLLDDDLIFQDAFKAAVGVVFPSSEVDVFSESHDSIAGVAAMPIPYHLAVVSFDFRSGLGSDVIRYLYRQSPRTMIVALSDGHSQDQVFNAVRLGASGYIIKGDGMLPLARVVEYALHGISPISPSVHCYFVGLIGRDDDPADVDQKPSLTARELRLLKEFSLGKSYKEAANSMGISVYTVRTHTNNIYRKLGVKSSLAALATARKAGLI